MSEHLRDRPPPPRFSLAPLLALPLTLWGLGACTERSEPPPPASDVPGMAAPKQAPLEREAPRVGQAPSRLAVRTAPTGAQDAGTQPDPALEGSLEDFAGFSADERQFAFTVYSEGAGFHLLHIVEGPEGRIAQRFILDTAENLEAARRALKARGFSTRSGSLPAGVEVTAAVRDGQVVVTQTRGGIARELYRGDPFGMGGSLGPPASATVAKVSPSGRRVAVRVDQVPVTEFGGITTHLVVEVTP